ncbi:hypothetical protein [Sediminivirga luteola]|uniref:Uncharacterized protein n=1 Tax=Sediminivirga luteola TaxID=1774748 RepID=A0A8J2TWQ8_9MICO|nr:hypothetical protein [Sediminivirga luteola]GGA09000.1 hypothetical protein GCM10011333_09980 [Sediminivirga luteola]
MPRLTIALGIVLVVLGLISYAATAFASWTALIPSILGLLLLIFGLVGLKRPKLGIHVALVIAAVGIAGTAMNVMQLGDLFAGTAERPAAVIVSTITFVLLIAYVIAGVRSFINARRWKDQQAA